MSVPTEWQALVDAALAARGQAYAPYSKFCVGCALEDERGRIYTGCNVENSNYSEGLCAERVAVVKMVSEGGRALRRVAVVTSADAPCFPCGSCLQVLQEFGAPRVLAVNPTLTQFQEMEFNGLLPHRFSGEELRR
ncbi:cytidine deaminase [bacterium]|nr:cytidine deaminase [bacterium]